MNTVFSDKVSKEVLNFMKILIDKKRGEAIFDIAKDFAEMVNDHKGIKDGIVESVIPMTEDEIQKLSDKLEKLTGNKVNLTNVVNEDILGGILIRVGDRVIDGTFKNKLNNIRENLSQIIV
jgi:F-type H+-transporting ATPase subunit delta